MRKNIYTLCLMMFVFTLVKAQPNLNLYNFRNAVQSTHVNPGLRPQANLTLGLPGFYLNAENPGFTLNDFFKKGISGDSSISLFMANKDKNIKDFRTDLQLDMIYFGFGAGRNYFNLGVQLNHMMNIGLPKDLVGFAMQGPFSYFGKNADFSDFQLNTQSYISYYLGYTREFGEKLSIGIRAKYLNGLVYAQTERASMIWRSDSGASNAYKFTAAADFLVQGAGFEKIKQIADDTVQSKRIENATNLFTQSGNNGYGIDVGVNYKATRKWSFSASMVDLGYITWKSNAKKYELNNAKFDFQGLDSTHYSYDSASFFKKDIDKLIIDTLEKVFKANERNEEFTSYLNTKFFIGAQFSINHRNYLGAVFMGEFRKNKFIPALNVSFTKKFWSLMDARVSWSYYNNRYDNLGFGLTLNMMWIQPYVFADNVLSLADYPNAQWFNIRAGININFVQNKDKDGDGIPNRKDKCRRVYGLEKFNGCPDTDGDGITDALDSCVKVKGVSCTGGCPDADRDCVADHKDSCVNDSGLATLNGCPDRDNDGVADKLDKCPSIPGPAEYQGCPDRDGDGVIDSLDRCPDDKGTPEFNGCPDTDSDGVADPDDSCRTTAGLKQFNGCPDTDGDGMIDLKDDCPNERGLTQFNGCPDSDGDGIPDKSDSCVMEFGIAAKNGCPEVKDTNAIVLTVEERKVLNEAFSNLEFETGTAKISLKSLVSLTELAELLVEKPNYKLNISGHTDNVGKEASNKKLSQSRADAVKTFLVSKGVDKARLNAKGFGSKKPVASNKTPEGRQRNRRVEFLIVK